MKLFHSSQIIDFPPGTGDVPLTLCQSVTLSGAVIVTTPHPLSVIDVAKGMQMFRDVRVPILAIVENMAPFTDTQGRTYAPFGIGGKARMLRYFEMKDSPLITQQSERESILQEISDRPFFSFPLMMTSIEASQDTDSFQSILKETLRPIVLSFPQSELAKLFTLLGSHMIREIFKLQMNAYLIPAISYVEHRGIILRYYTASNAEEYVIDPVKLRSRDPKTGAFITLKSIVRFECLQRSRYI